jgi:hypothetical protein
VNLHAAVASLARQHDNFGNDELGDASRVGVWRVEDGDSLACGKGQVRLIKEGGGCKIAVSNGVS